MSSQGWEQGASMGTQGNLLFPVTQASCLPSLSIRTYGRYNVYLILG